MFRLEKPAGREHGAQDLLAQTHRTYALGGGRVPVRPRDGDRQTFRANSGRLTGRARNPGAKRLSRPALVGSETEHEETFGGVLPGRQLFQT